MDTSLWDLIPGKWVGSPGSSARLAHGGWVIDRIAQPTKGEVTAEHVGVRRSGGLWLAVGPFVVPAVAEKEKSFVPAVVELRYIDRTGDGGLALVIVVGEVARVLLEVLAVIHGAVLVAIFESAVELVGPAFEDEADRAAGGVSQFRGRARTPKLHLFKCVDGRLDKSA